MPRPPRDLARERAAEFIRRAEQRALDEQASDILARMQQDDELDEMEGFEPTDSGGPPGSELASGDSFMDDSFALESCGESGNKTTPEPDSSRESTVNLSSDDLMDSGSGFSDVGIEDSRDSVESTPNDLAGPTSTPTISLTPVLRPVCRPPMAILRVYDDGMSSYQQVRVRSTPYGIGRKEGQFVVGFDSQVSSRHCRIKRNKVPLSNNEYTWEWILEDMKSMNGTFLRVDRVQLEDGGFFLIGGELVRVSHPSKQSHLTLIKSSPKGEERVIIHRGETVFIGSDQPDCLDFMRENSYLDPRHLRIAESDTHWVLTDMNSTNGVWKRIETAVLRSGDQFQAGEQRFGFYLP